MPSPPVLIDSSKLDAPLENAGHDCPELTPHGGTTHTQRPQPPPAGRRGSLGQQKACSGDNSAAEAALLLLLLLFSCKVVKRLQ